MGNNPVVRQVQDKQTSGYQFCKLRCTCPGHIRKCRTVRTAVEVAVQDTVRVQEGHPSRNLGRNAEHFRHAWAAAAVLPVQQEVACINGVLRRELQVRLLTFL